MLELWLHRLLVEVLTVAAPHYYYCSPRRARVCSFAFRRKPSSAGSSSLTISSHCVRRQYGLSGVVVEALEALGTERRMLSSRCTPSGLASVQAASSDHLITSITSDLINVTDTHTHTHTTHTNEHDMAPSWLFRSHATNPRAVLCCCYMPGITSPLVASAALGSLAVACELLRLICFVALHAEHVVNIDVGDGAAGLRRHQPDVFAVQLTRRRQNRPPRATFNRPLPLEFTLPT